MTAIKDGDLVRPHGITAWYHDDTVIGQISSTSYETGTPEVGVYFVAPRSGRVRVTVGGGFRDNGGSNTDRLFLSPQIYQGSSAGTQVLAPSVTLYGYAAASENTEFQYGCRVGLVSDLTPGQLYYIRTQHLTSPGTDPDSGDIAARDLIVIPVP